VCDFGARKILSLRTALAATTGSPVGYGPMTFEHNFDTSGKLVVEFLRKAADFHRQSSAPLGEGKRRAIYGDKEALRRHAEDASKLDKIAGNGSGFGGVDV
jgi:hypothetical protein